MTPAEAAPPLDRSTAPPGGRLALRPSRALGAVGLLAALLVLAGCTTTDPSSAPTTALDAASASDLGTVVALDDFAAIHLLTLGVTPDVVLDAFQYETTGAVLDSIEGIDVRPYGSELDVEAVLATSPDVVVGVSLPTTVDVQDDLEQFADVTVLDYTDSWEAQLADVAAAVGREEQAAALVERLGADLDALADDLQGTEHAGGVVSVLANNQSLYSVPATSGLGTVLSGAGLERPAAQLEPDGGPENPFVTVTAERLADHDGDVLFVLTGGAYDPAPVYATPLYDTLGAVTSGESYEASGEIWLGTSAFSVDWVIRDLRAVLVDGGQAATPDQAADRFEQFLAGS